MTGTSTGPSALLEHARPATTVTPNRAQGLDISSAQAYALVRCGDLPAIKVGGRGQWRIERAALEEYIARMYAQTRAFVAANPLGGRDDDTALDDEPDA